MDPGADEIASGAERIPRTRGDGPRRLLHSAPSPSDSPHARGWTRRLRTAPRSAAGFPARAGMDPPACLRGRSSVGIPRTRGDGPGRGRDRVRGGEDSPHARGWTRRRRRGLRQGPGFPARAGMDPFDAQPGRGPVRIPRTRGDGPSSGSATASISWDSPHARGWTRSEAGAADHGGGFPARAGMDPSERRCRLSPRWIPRTRGDGPAGRGCGTSPPADSPHARGWTRLFDGGATADTGFPARAGMDPLRRFARSSETWIPRTRGDGPSWLSVPVDRHLDSPHARGWTLDAEQLLAVERGFPARAGMDPAPLRRLPYRRRIPRTRGDGPIVHRQAEGHPVDSPHARGWTPSSRCSRRDVTGFPARAGMDREPGVGKIGAARIPRTRGDGPGFPSLIRLKARDSPHARGWTVIQPGRDETAPRDSPHARGWTRCSCRPPADRRGFPARAGMDPADRAASTDPARIPRTRGDGPGISSCAAIRPSDSPHARGWTRPRPRGRGAPAGFPARAGMDPASRSADRTACGIPRTRGDGPPRGCWPAGFLPDSPHARGWTDDALRQTRQVRGFPARAGMDLAAVRGRSPWLRIPRTRGDGPRQHHVPAEFAPDSPHARGWTVTGYMTPAERRGFPARAGMDPWRWSGVGRASGIPRTRGDGPGRFDASNRPRRDSPHARGWTAFERSIELHGIGFPARAGMDPGRGVRRRRVLRIPRTRGDGPDLPLRLVDPARDSPHARGWTRGRGRRVPQPTRDSPHARGWTHPANSLAWRAFGFPARAGMDP